MLKLSKSDIKYFNVCDLVGSSKAKTFNLRGSSILIREKKLSFLMLGTGMEEYLRKMKMLPYPIR